MHAGRDLSVKQCSKEQQSCKTHIFLNKLYIYMHIFFIFLKMVIIISQFPFFVLNPLMKNMYVPWENKNIHLFSKAIGVVPGSNLQNVDFFYQKCIILLRTEKCLVVGSICLIHIHICTYVFVNTRTQAGLIRLEVKQMSAFGV